MRKVALCDFLTRRFLEAAQKAGADQRTQSGGWSGAKGGEITIDEPGQHILERTSVVVHDDGAVEARFTVAMPARGTLLVLVLLLLFPLYIAQCLQNARGVDYRCKFRYFLGDDGAGWCH